MNATHLVEILLTLGRAKEARRYAEEAIALTGDADPPTLQTLSCWATLSAFEGRVSEAAQLFGFLDAECPRQEVPRYPGQALRGKLDSLVESRFLVAELLDLCRGKRIHLEATFAPALLEANCALEQRLHKSRRVIAIYFGINSVVSI
jgi:hypothetical protein